MTAVVADSPRTWRQLPVGAGGWLTGFDQHTDGTLVCRCDTYGGWIWDAGTSSWSQLVTSLSMPSGDVHVDYNEGIFEICIAPSNSQIFYMFYFRKLYRSTNRGRNWTLCAASGWSTAVTNANPNAPNAQRYSGPKMAIDPLNSDVVYIGMRDGLWRTLNAGATAALCSDVATPIGSSPLPGVVGIVFNPTSSSVSGRTATLWASSHGNGYYKTTDGGDTWSKPSGGPSTSVARAAFSVDGVLWCHEYPGTHLWRNTSGTWAEISTGVSTTSNSGHAVSPDPFDNDRVLISSGGGNLQESLNANAGTPTWSSLNFAGVTRTADDIPWFEMANEVYMSNGDIRFHPTIQNRLMFSQGIGFWYADMAPGMTGSSAVNWISMSRGIEQLVANHMIATPASALSPSGNIILATWDRPIWKIIDPTEYPSEYKQYPNSVRQGFCVDYCSTNPDFITCTAGALTAVGTNCGYSFDGGDSYAAFATTPPYAHFGGIICAGTVDNLLWAPSNAQRPYYTLDRGANWNACTFPGVNDDATADGYQGFHFGTEAPRLTACADRSTPGTFYMYHNKKGVYRTTDGGANWINVAAAVLPVGTVRFAKMRNPEGKPGHLWLTAGLQGSSADYATPSGSLYRSTNGGENWLEIADVLEPNDINFGKAAPGATYPTIWIYGWLNGVQGIYYSTDEAVSWVKVGVWPIDSLDQITCIDASKVRFGEAYVGFAGSGFAWTSGVITATFGLNLGF